MQLKVRDAARFLNVTEKTIYSWIAKRGLPARPFNGQYRLNPAELVEWAATQGIDIPSEALLSDKDAPAPGPDLGAALEQGGIFYRVQGDDKLSVLRAVVKLMKAPESVDREFLLRVLVAREAMASTGVGEGIAIPHARNPIVLNVSAPLITLCFLAKPVDYDAIDGRLVDTLFTVVTPNVRVHLQVLGKLASALQDAAFRNLIVKKSPPEEILAAARALENP